MRITKAGRPVAVALALLLAGCGGGGDTASENTSREKPTTTTTTVSVEAKNAEEAVIRQADLGEPWKEESPAKGIVKVSPESCMTKAGIFDELAEDAGYQGARFQRGEAQQFVQSNALTFPTEEQAKAMTARLTTEEHVTCSAERMTAESAAAPGAPEGSRFRVHQVFTPPEGGGDGGYEGSVHYQFQAISDGKLQDANGFVQNVVYRKGRTVLHVTIDSLFQEGDPDDLDALVNDEATKAAQLAIARAS